MNTQRHSLNNTIYGFATRTLLTLTAVAVLMIVAAGSAAAQDFAAIVKTSGRATAVN